MGSRAGEPVARTNSSGGGGSSKDSGSFECNICLDLAQDPVVTLCGHLFCWPCLYEWLHVHAHSQECPVCKAVVEEGKLVPLYGRGGNSTSPRARSVAGVEIPSRPTGQRPSTAPQPDHSNHYPPQNLWFMGAGAPPVAGGRWGNYTFSAAIGGLFPLLSFQVHGFPQVSAYGPAAGFPYGYGHSFHGWHGHGYGFPRQAPQGQQVDAYLKVLLLVVGVLVIASLIAF
jgi:E3 ubiquitin-protein ligase RNF5